MITRRCLWPYKIFPLFLHHLLTSCGEKGRERAPTPQRILLFSRLDNDSDGDGYPFQSFAFSPLYFFYSERTTTPVPAVYYTYKCERKKLRTDGRKRDIADVGLAHTILLHNDQFLLRKKFSNKIINIRVIHCHQQQKKDVILRNKNSNSNAVRICWLIRITFSDAMHL